MANGSISSFNIKETIMMDDKHDDHPIHIRIKIPEFTNKQLVVHSYASDTIWAVKMKVLKTIEKTLNDPFNYGLYLPDTTYKRGKFLDEERMLKEYYLRGPMPDLDFKKKHRINYLREANMVKIKKLQNQTTKKEFIQYVRQFDAEKMQKLLNKGFDPNFNDLYDGETPLTMLARTNNSRSCIIALVNGGAILDFRNKNNETALHVAVKFDCRSALRTLLDLGSAVNYKDGKDLTPLYYAVLHNTEGLCLQFLLHERAFIGCRDEKGWTEIHHACHKGNSKHIEQLLFYGADINSHTITNETPLHICAMNNQMTCANDILLRGADRSKKNDSEQTAEDIAKRNNNDKLANLIRNFKDEDIIYFDGMPEYNEKRKGTISVATLRNLFRSRSIPDLYDKNSDEYKSLSVSPTNFKTIHPYSLSPNKSTTRIFDVNWEGDKKDEINQPPELQKALDNFDAVLAPENVSLPVERDAQFVPPPPPIPTSLISTIPKALTNNEPPTISATSTIQKKYLAELNNDRLKEDMMSEILNVVRQRKSVLDNLNGELVNETIEDRVNKTKKTVFKSYHSGAPSIINDGSKSPLIKINDINTNLKINPTVTDKESADLTNSIKTDIQASNSVVECDIHNDNIRPTGDYLADAQQVLQNYLTLTKKSKQEKKMAEVIDNSSPSETIESSCNNVIPKDIPVKIKMAPTIPSNKTNNLYKEIKNDNENKIGSDVGKTNNINDPAKENSVSSIIKINKGSGLINGSVREDADVNIRSKSSEGTLKKPLLIRPASSIYEAPNIINTGNNSKTIKNNLEIQLDYMLPNKSYVQKVDSFPIIAKSANESLKFDDNKNDNSKAQLRIKDNYKKNSTLINGQDDKQKVTSTTSTLLIAKSPDPSALQNHVNSLNNDVLKLNSQSTLINNNSTLSKSNNTKLENNKLKNAEFVSPSLIKPPESKHLHLPDSNGNSHASTILEPPKEFSTGTSKRYNAPSASNSTVFAAKTAIKSNDKNLNNWSTEDVTNWLNENALSMYKDLFIKVGIDGKRLAMMKRADLEQLGVVNVLHQMKIENNVKKLSKVA